MTERREAGQEVAFDRGTWVKIFGLVLVMLGMGAGLAAFTFQTQADATTQAAETLAKANAYTDKESVETRGTIRETKDAVDKDTERLEKNQNAILRKLEVIGYRLGVGKQVRNAGEE